MGIVSTEHAPLNNTVAFINNIASIVGTNSSAVHGPHIFLAENALTRYTAVVAVTTKNPTPHAVKALLLGPIDAYIDAEPSNEALAAVLGGTNLKELLSLAMKELPLVPDNCEDDLLYSSASELHSGLVDLSRMTAEQRGALNKLFSNYFSHILK